MACLLKVECCITPLYGKYVYIEQTDKYNVGAWQVTGLEYNMITKFRRMCKKYCKDHQTCLTKSPTGSQQNSVELYVMFV